MNNHELVTRAWRESTFEEKRALYLIVCAIRQKRGVILGSEEESIELRELVLATARKYEFPLITAEVVKETGFFNVSVSVSTAT